MTNDIEKNKKNSTLYFLGLRYSIQQSSQKNKDSINKLKQKDESHTFEQGLNHFYYNPDNDKGEENGSSLKPNNEKKKKK